jgi:DNA mismatch repair protein MSH5
MNPSPVSFLVPGDSVGYDELAALNSYQSTGRQGKLLRISGCIDLDNKMSMGCVGAILTYLQRKRRSEYLQDDPDAQRAYQVTNMEMFSLKDTMLVTIARIYGKALLTR